MVAFLFSWLSKILAALFFLGLVGSAVVVIITFIEDGKLLLERDDPGKPSESIPKDAREAF